MDISGKIMTTKSVTINGETQTENFALTPSIAKGTYVIKVVDENNKVIGVNNVVVQ